MSGPVVAASRRLPAAAVLIAVLALSACATTPPTVPAASEPVPVVDVPVPPATEDVPPVAGPVAGAMPLTALPGWDHEDHLAAFNAWRTGCGVARDPAAAALCARARTLARRPVSPSDARAFLETGFVAVPAVTDDGGPGRLTAYFAPEYTARHQADAEYDAPVLGPPDDLVRRDGQTLQRRADGSTGPYPDRAVIEATPLTTAPLAWMRAEDLFFLQIQGSGYLTFADGGRARVAYAADNGAPFVGIARPMARDGLLPPNGTSGDAIRAWLAAHRGPGAGAVMALNPRYIFFRIDADDGGDPAGAAGIPLPARRAIAVDPAHWRYGDLVWLSADGGNLIGARGSYQGAAMALDTGSAIRGPVRADLYMGRGESAGAEAGAVRHPLRMWRLVPRPDGDSGDR
ncbi:MAG: MltA domain-containing protein [Brevundimonas sp.]